MTLVLGEGLTVLILVLTVTAYCGCADCTAPYNDGITAMGTRVQEGRTVAAGPSIPFGTLIHISSVGWRVVEDRGGAITDSRLDLYFDSHSDALRFGVRELTVFILERR